MRKHKLDYTKPQSKIRTNKVGEKKILYVQRAKPDEKKRLIKEKIPKNEQPTNQIRYQNLRMTI